MNRENYVAAEQAAFTAAERAFDASPCQKTATKLSNARVNLERKKEEWRVSPAGRAENLAVLQVIAIDMREIAYTMDEFSECQLNSHEQNNTQF
jgi:hypothetical protein